MEERRRPSSQGRYIPSILSGRKRVKSSKASVAEEKEVVTEPSLPHVSADAPKKPQKKVKQVFHYYFTRKSRRKSTGSPSQSSVVSGISAVSAVSPTATVPPLVTLEGYAKDLVIRNPTRKPTVRASTTSTSVAAAGSRSCELNHQNTRDKQGLGDLVVGASVDEDISVLTKGSSEGKAHNILQHLRPRKKGAENTFPAKGFADSGKQTAKSATSTIPEEDVTFQVSERANLIMKDASNGFGARNKFDNQADVSFDIVSSNVNYHSNTEILRAVPVQQQGYRIVESANTEKHFDAPESKLKLARQSAFHSLTELAFQDLEPSDHGILDIPNTVVVSSNQVPSLDSRNIIQTCTPRNDHGGNGRETWAKFTDSSFDTSPAFFGEDVNSDVAHSRGSRQIRSSCPVEQVSASAPNFPTGKSVDSGYSMLLHAATAEELENLLLIESPSSPFFEEQGPSLPPRKYRSFGDEGYPAHRPSFGKPLFTPSKASVGMRINDAGSQLENMESLFKPFPESPPFVGTLPGDFSTTSHVTQLTRQGDGASQFLGAETLSPSGGVISELPTPHMGDNRWEPWVGEEQKQSLRRRHGIGRTSPVDAQETIPHHTNSASPPKMKDFSTQADLHANTVAPSVSTQTTNESSSSWMDSAIRNLEKAEWRRGGTAQSTPQTQSLIIPSWLLLACAALLMAVAHYFGVRFCRGKLCN